MKLSAAQLTDLYKALPTSFSFYHLGEVIQDPSQDQHGAAPVSREIPLTAQALGYKIFQDHPAYLVILFAQGLDISLYSEMGNIIASQLASTLGNAVGESLMISPPETISPSQLERLIQNSQGSWTERKFLHRLRQGQGQDEVELHAFLFAAGETSYV